MKRFVLLFLLFLYLRMGLNAQTVTLVQDIRPGILPSHPTGSIVFNNKLYFEAGDGTLGNATVAQIVTNINQTSATVSNLSKETFYSVALIPFNWDGSTAASKNYKVDGDLASLTVSTIPTLDKWGLIALAALILFGGIYIIRNKV